MGPTGDEVFLLFFILAEFGVLLILAYAAVWLYDKRKARKDKQAKKRAAKRKQEWAAEIEKAGIKLMNATADYRRKKHQTVTVKGVFADMAKVWE